jgi:RNA polymerase sigma-70 factor (ECF subfamily)
MPGRPDDTSQVQLLLDRMGAGDRAAAAEVIGRTLGRLRRLTRKMLRSFPGVGRWEQTDDVLHNAALRLQRSLEQLPVGSARDFFGLAAAHIRRELIDLARHYLGPEGPGAHHHSARADSRDQRLGEPTDCSGDPGRLAEWSEFHLRVEQLPAEEREVFNLLWYHDLPQAEAAALLQVTERTVRRRWREARRLLGQTLLGDQAPADEPPP